MPIRMSCAAGSAARRRTAPCRLAGAEQHECWGEHRVARRGRAWLVGRGEGWLEGEVRDCWGNRVQRRIELTGEGLSVRDRVVARGRGFEKRPARRAFLDGRPVRSGALRGRADVSPRPEFGALQKAALVVRRGEDAVDSELLLAGSDDRKVVQ